MFIQLSICIANINILYTSAGRNSMNLDLSAAKTYLCEVKLRG